MKPYKKSELIGVLAIFAIVFFVTYLNMQTALRRSRDAQRRSDLGEISDALNKFQSEFGYFPLAENGKIKMCKGERFVEVMQELKELEEFDRDLFYQGLKGCEWGFDSLSDVTDSAYEPYLKHIPADPKREDGYSYLYLSNQNRYQIYSTLEGESDEIGYDEGIVRRNLLCGKDICSYGKTYAAVLDKSIEEYEAELIQKSSGNN